MVKNLNQLHTEHASALVAEAALQAELDAAQTEYNKLLEQFEAQHTDVVNRLKQAREKHNQAIQATKSVDTQVRSMLTGAKFDELPSGYEQVRKKKVVYNEKTLLQAAIQHAPFLLTIDQKKLEQFAFAVAEEVTKTESGGKLAEPYFVLPEHYRMWLPSLHINFEWSPRISTAKVQVYAPQPSEEKIESPFSIVLDGDKYRHYPKNLGETLCGKSINTDQIYNQDFSRDRCPECVAIFDDMMTELVYTEVMDAPKTPKVEPLDAVGIPLTDEPNVPGKATVVNAADLLQNYLKVSVEVNDESPSGVSMTFAADDDESDDDDPYKLPF